MDGDNKETTRKPEPLFDSLIKEKRENPQEPVLYHGTISTRFNAFRQPDGSYKNPGGDPIWLDEEGQIPFIRAETDAKETGADRILLFVRTDKLKVRRPSNVPGPDEDVLIRPKFWITDSLPADSYVSYNLTQDPLGLEPKDAQPDALTQVEKIAKICEPLGVVPTYVTLIRRRAQAEK